MPSAERRGMRRGRRRGCFSPTQRVLKDRGVRRQIKPGRRGSRRSTQAAQLKERQPGASHCSQRQPLENPLPCRSKLSAMVLQISLQHVVGSSSLICFCLLCRNGKLKRSIPS